MTGRSSPQIASTAFFAALHLCCLPTWRLALRCPRNLVRPAAFELSPDDPCSVSRTTGSNRRRIMTVASAVWRDLQASASRYWHVSVLRSARARSRMADRVGLRKHALACFRPRANALGSPRCTRRPKRLAAFCRTWVRSPHPVGTNKKPPNPGGFLLMADSVSAHIVFAVVRD